MMSKVNLELLKALEDILVDLKIRASLTYEPEVLDVSCSELIRARNAIDRAKGLLLAQPEQEPANKVVIGDSFIIDDTRYVKSSEPLSDEEILKLYRDFFRDTFVMCDMSPTIVFARTIEKAHGIGVSDE
jgi:hypothetical protein